MHDRSERCWWTRVRWKCESSIGLYESHDVVVANFNWRGSRKSHLFQPWTKCSYNAPSSNLMIPVLPNCQHCVIRLSCPVPHCIILPQFHCVTSTCCWSSFTQTYKTISWSLSLTSSPSQFFLPNQRTSLAYEIKTYLTTKHVHILPASISVRADLQLFPICLYTFPSPSRILLIFVSQLEDGFTHTICKLWSTCANVLFLLPTKLRLRHNLACFLFSIDLFNCKSICSKICCCQEKK